MMWVDYTVRYIRENKVTGIFLAVMSFVAAALLSLLDHFFYNLWLDEIKRTGALSTGPVFWAYGSVLALMCISLVAMIHHAFGVSMNSRLHQLGILASVGASPGQIRLFLLQEALVLCGIPVLLGTASGIGLCYGLLQLIVVVTKEARQYTGHEVVFCFHVGAAFISFMIAMVTVLISAWIPARRISKMSPMEAIRYGGEEIFETGKKGKYGSLYAMIFRVLGLGIEGELAARSVRARKKALRTSTVSLTLSYLALIVFLSLETISGISTQHTYFERYRDKWDMMLMVEESREAEGQQEADEQQDAKRQWEADGWTAQIREIEGVESCIAYKKINGKVRLDNQQLSEEVLQSGVLMQAEGIEQAGDGGYIFPMVMYVLDEKSFREYCVDYDIQPQAEVVVLNCIWNHLRSDRMNREYIPLLRADETIVLDWGKVSGEKVNGERIGGENTVETKLEIEAYTDALPQIREELQQHALSLVLSEKQYQSLVEVFPGAESSSYYYNMKLSSEDTDEKVQEELRQMLGTASEYTLESRAEKEASEKTMRGAFRFVMGVLAFLLACIGIANVFSSTLGQTYQRAREFAGYFSVGMSYQGMKKIFAAEALLIGLRPLLISLLVDIPVVVLALRAALISGEEFVRAMPVWEIGLFTLFVLGAIGVAYYMGGRSIMRKNLVDMLRDETMV